MVCKKKNPSWMFGAHRKIHGFVPVEMWLLIVCDTAFYAIMWLKTQNIRATSWQNQQNGMCALQRLGSARASSQSDRSLLSAWRKLGSPLSAQRRLIRLGGCPGWSESGCIVILLVFSWGRSLAGARQSEWDMLWKNLFMPFANNKGVDQPAYLCNLISTFLFVAQIV